MRANQATVASFDIFDTIVTRRVANPRSAFLLLGRRLVTNGEITCSAHCFATARTNAEIRTFRNAGGLDSSVSLRDIYHELANALHLSAECEELLYEREIELETELLVLLPDGAARVAAARKAGQQVVFVSDMYLASSFLENILSDMGVFESDDKLFVSNEVARSKATGTMWRTVLDDLQASPSDVEHVGNDIRSDGISAKRAGLRAVVLEENNPNRYEEALEQHAAETDGLASCLAGASRLARLDPPDSNRRTISDVAAGVVAPFVIGNLLWTLEVARRDGIDELFFVARDGQILCDVARELAPKVGYQGRLTYIYGSRQAWALASITDRTDVAIDSLIPSQGDVPATLEMVLRRLDLSPEEIAEPLKTVGLTSESWARNMTPDETDRLRLLVRDDPDIRWLVRDRAKQSRDVVLSYLEQVGAVTDKPIGFVDLGTGATLFNALSAILATVGQPAPTGFYFGLRSHLPNAGFGRPLTYVRDEDERVGFLRTPGLLTLVELACTADHGSVVGYSDDAGVLEPTFSKQGNEPVVDWGLPIVRETIRRVANELLLSPDLVGLDSIDLRPAVLDVFDLFWNSPTRAEAVAWGAYPFEDGWGDDAYRHPIAEPQRLRGLARGKPHRHFWHEGAQQLSGPVARRAFHSRQRLIDTRNKVRRRYA